MHIASFAAPQRRQAVRWVAGLVLMCLLAQALLLPVQRTKERLHFHLGSAAVSAVVDMPSVPPTLARVAFSHRKSASQDDDVPHAHEHAHASLQDHEHGALSGVVYVSDDAGPSSGGHGANKRGLLDQDGLKVSAQPWLMLTAARIGFIKSSMRLPTRTEPPLERPPRPRS